jgi:hypothetical protein
MEWLDGSLLLLVLSWLPFRSSHIAYFLAILGSSRLSGGPSLRSSTSAITIWPMNRLWLQEDRIQYRWYSSLRSCCCLRSVFTRVCWLVSFVLMFGGRGRSRSKRISLPISKFSVLLVITNTNILKGRRSNRRSLSIFLSFWRSIGRTPMNAPNISEWWLQELAGWEKGRRGVFNKTKLYFIWSLPKHRLPKV